MMPQIEVYHRPTSVEEALQLLNRPGVKSVIVAGGTYIVPRIPETVQEVIDLQAVGLTEVNYTGQGLTLGAMVRLQTIVDDNRAPNLLREAARLSGPNTVRNAATIGGLVASPFKESELLAALLVFNSQIRIQTNNGSREIPLEQFLMDVPSALSGGLVTAVSLETMGQTASARVGRTPADQAIVAAMARRDNGGQIRLALCGVAGTPVLVEPENVKAAVSPPQDFRGSREYRRQMAAVLSKRVLAELG